MFVQDTSKKQARHNQNQTSPTDLTTTHPPCNDKFIVLRGRRYQLRIRVPVILVPCLGRSEIRLSLGTTVRREALRRGLPFLARIERIFDTLRGEIVTEGTMQDICLNFYDNLMNGIPAGRRAEELSKMDDAAVDVALVRYGKLIEKDRIDSRYGRFSHIENTLERFAAQSGTFIDKQSENYPLLLHHALQTRIRAFETKKMRGQGEYDCILDRPAARTSTVVPPATTTAVQQLTARLASTTGALTVAELCELFITDKNVIDGAWDAASTLVQVRSALANFCAIIGDQTPVSTIVRTTLNRYKASLAGLPNQKLKPYSGKTVAELLAMDIPKQDRISKKTLNNQLIWVKALCDWACLNDYMVKSYTKGLTIKRSVVDKHRRDECDPYVNEEAQNVFGFEGFTYNPNRLERFWGPLIAAHTSGRLNEVGQLLVEDVSRVGGVLCFRMVIEEEQLDQDEMKKKLKTQASKRNIPVHKFLLELGFENYVNELRAAGETRLFPKLPASPRGYGVELGKWYGREISAKLFPDSKRRKVFNSFRHSVDDQLKNMPDMRDSMQLYITGHATGKEAFDRYGRAPEAANLQAFIDRIDYGLDLEVLRKKMANPVITHRGPKKKNPAAEAPQQEAAAALADAASGSPRRTTVIVRKRASTQGAGAEKGAPKDAR